MLLPATGEVSVVAAPIARLPPKFCTPLVVMPVAPLPSVVLPGTLRLASAVLAPTMPLKVVLALPALTVRP